MFPISQQTIDDENSYQLVAALFVRLLAAIYLIAFYTMTFQVIGLVGDDGILPVRPWMEALLVDLGMEAYLFYPMVFWVGNSDAVLEFVPWAGCLLAVLLFFNILPRLMLVTLFIAYLSLVTAGQTFMNFQWDSLLLEAGFLAIFLRPDSKVMIFLFRWLLFRLRFMSGISKLVMGDPAWLGMTALIYYFETQPLPPVGAWYFHNLPTSLLIGATIAVLIVEIVVPFMMFLPRRYRLIAAWITLLFQLLILLSSNHNWFNLLAMAMCLFLFDDKALSRVLPMWLQRWLSRTWQPRLQHPSRAMIVHGKSILALVVIGAGLLSIVRLAVIDDLGRPLNYAMDVVQGWRVVNAYHVFPTMTTRLIELKVEGSLDGINWRPYEFIYRPSALDERPKIVWPHHPRLDWMAWFVPFSPRFLYWFDSFLIALLENSSAVTSLLKDNPFKDKPPRYLRVHAWHYQFTTPQERAQSGNWWKRTYLGLFAPLPGKQRLD